MKIDYESINHTAMMVIKEYIGSPYEYSESSDDADHSRLVTIGFIYGVTQLADALKEVLKS